MWFVVFQVSVRNGLFVRNNISQRFKYEDVVNDLNSGKDKVIYLVVVVFFFFKWELENCEKSLVKCLE